MQQRIGPYRVVQELGRGGQGVVYRVEHHETGAAAALKTVRTPSPERMQGLRREIHALARLEHPGVVRILEEGEQAGEPWYAMELVEGPGLLEHCRGLWDPSRKSTKARRAKGLRELLTVLRKLCAPLAYVHGEGIVHRDLKPDNIIVRAASGEQRAASSNKSGSSSLEARRPPLAALGMPVLVDFGLMQGAGAGTGRESLALPGREGTAAYMAPEQARGELVDARADLYGLGCLFYEVLTARPTHRTLQEALEADRRPVAPSQLVEGLPEELDELVLRLLSADPAERIGHADVVAAALVRLGAEAGPATGPAPRAYLYRPGFEGREPLLRALVQHVEARLWSGIGGLILMGGESGIGKTRFALELGRAVGSSGVRVLAGECGAGEAFSGLESARAAHSVARRSHQQGTLAGARVPLEGLRKPLQALAGHCREHGPAETERLLGRRGKVLAAYEPALSGLPGLEAYPEPAELPAREARLRLYADLAETFVALADTAQAPLRAPVLLILDDLQWADELTLGFLELLLTSGRLERSALLVLGTYRTEEAGAELQRLRSEPQARCLELGRLEEASVAALVGDMLAMRPAPQLFARHLARHSEGNPFFVAEYLRAALEQGLLWRDAQGRWQVGVGVGAQHAAPEAAPEAVPEATEALYENLPLPHSLRELVSRRLEGLGELARSCVEAAAVLGRQMEATLLAQVAGLQGTRMMEAVTELLHRQVLEQLETGELRFLHDKLREAASDQIAAEPRRKLHERAAKTLEATAPEARQLSFAWFAVLGHHWERAGDFAQARKNYLEAARGAVASHGYREAERLYRAALDLYERLTPESVAARNELGGRVLLSQGRNLEALQVLEVAGDEARQLEDRFQEAISQSYLAELAKFSGALPKAYALDQRVLAFARNAGHLGLQSRSLAGMASSLAQQGRMFEAEALHRQSLAVKRKMGDRGLEAFTLGSLGKIYMMQGRQDKARDYYEQALALARATGNRGHEGMMLQDIAMLHQDCGALEEARELHLQAAEILCQVGDRHSAGVNLGNLARVYHEEGRLEEAEKLYQEALAVKREIGDRKHIGYTLCPLGRLRMDQGRMDEALALNDEALLIAREVGLPRFEGICLVERAVLARRGQRKAEAKQSLERAEALLLDAMDRYHLAKILCEKGHQGLVERRPVHRWLTRARKAVAALEAGPRSALGKSLASLEAAVRAAEAGEHHRIFRGELIEDLPEGLRRWLEQTGQIPAAH